jgi:hypothetical protein
MSNRTNLTLSAHTHRLNLGSRTLAHVASVVGTTTNPRLRHAIHSHQGISMRAERMTMNPSIIKPAYPEPKPELKRGPRKSTGLSTFSSSSFSLESSSLSPWRFTSSDRTQGSVVVGSSRVRVRGTVDRDVLGLLSDQPSWQDRQAFAFAQPWQAAAAAANATQAICQTSRSARSTIFALAFAVTS